MIARSLLWGAIALALPTAAFCQAPGIGAVAAPGKSARSGPVEEKKVLAGQALLDPAKGYIFVSGPERRFGIFLRVPDAEARAVWEKDRQVAFVKAQKRYRSLIAEWQAQAIARKEYKQIGRAHV